MNVRINHALNFLAGVWYSDMLVMNQYVLNLEMTTASPEYSVAFERVKYFVYNQLESTVFIDQNDKDQCKRLLDAGINITTVPGPPFDQLVGVILYHKLNAITEGHIVINQTDICSSLGENIHYLHGEFEIANIDDLPKWCMLSDLSHMDHDLQNSEKIVTLKSSNWSELDLNWSTSVSNTNSGNTVVFPMRDKNDSE